MARGLESLNCCPQSGPQQTSEALCLQSRARITFGSSCLAKLRQTQKPLPEHQGSSKTGSLDVSFAAVREVPGYNAPPHAAVGAQQAAALKPVEGKKWFLQPSLSAQQGQVTGPPLTFSTKRYVDVQQLANCSMRMETAAILILRKVLNPDFPTHKAIIDQSQPEDEQEGSSDQNVPPVAARNEVSSNRIGIKRERTANSPGAHKAIKREPTGVSGRSDANEDECIDLT